MSGKKERGLHDFVGVVFESSSGKVAYTALQPVVYQYPSATCGGSLIVTAKYPIRKGEKGCRNGKGVWFRFACCWLGRTFFVYLVDFGTVSISPSLNQTRRRKVERRKKRFRSLPGAVLSIPNHDRAMGGRKWGVLERGFFNLL